MKMIEMNHVTKDFGHHKGIFDVSFHVDQGEVVGFLGPNGAGKTTTIRQLMGFMRPDQGSVTIQGNDCFKEAHHVQGMIGYLPGEPAFMGDMTGMEFIRFIAHMKHMKHFERMQELIDFFEVDTRGYIRKMSKGMKQKIGMICAFMQDGEVLILDEPTSGLDPLMQGKFVELIRKEKERGKTILMSSHIFEEIEHTCDRVIIIKEGSIITDQAMADIRKAKRKIFELEFSNVEAAQSFARKYPQAAVADTRASIEVSQNLNAFLKDISTYSLVDINVQKQSLEQMFLHFYEGGIS